MTASDPRRLLEEWLRDRLDAEAFAWLSKRTEAAQRSGPDAAFLMAFSAAPRRVGRSDLLLSEEQTRQAALARPGWRPGAWSVDQAARAWLTLALPAADAGAWRRTLDGLFDDADLGELVALYQALPLLPHPEAHRARAAEGIRTNMKAVFEAIALDNPYPAEELDVDAFNQLVLKCLFIESPLYRVVGLEKRINERLARMLCHYAQERWAAGRSVSPELWRCVGPVADGRQLDDLRRVLDSGSLAEQLAAALSCAKNPKAKPLVDAFPAPFERVEKDPPSWSALAKNEV